LREYVRSWWSVFPYRCGECKERVYLRKETPAVKRRELPVHDMVIKLDGEKPTAQVVIQAETHEDLQKVIHSLNDALLSHEPKPEKSYSPSQ
jgi:hypothetical protein